MERLRHPRDGEENCKCISEFSEKEQILSWNRPEVIIRAIDSSVILDCKGKTNKDKWKTTDSIKNTIDCS